MNSLVDLPVVVGMALLRIGAPVLVIALLVYLFRRLDRRWERQARAELGVNPVAPPAAGMAQACWERNGCTAAARSKCPAASQPDQPCWQVKLAAEGNIPDLCVYCDVFQNNPAM